jgi:hypothetical protein
MNGETLLAWAGVEPTLVVMGTDCISSCKSNYRKITATTAPLSNLSRISPNQSRFDNLNGETLLAWAI